MTEEWLSCKWPALCEGYAPYEIFNTDETDLFYNLTPDKTLKFKGEKMSKSRITVLIVANMSGSTKEKLFVIGKSKKTSIFKTLTLYPLLMKPTIKLG